MPNTVEFHVDTRAFVRFSKALRKAQPELAKNLRKKLRAAGEEIAEIARRNASWSTTIPGSIKVRTSGPYVKVIAGGAKAQGARALEHRGLTGTFRHPVFPNPKVPVSEWTWVAQQAHPFLAPAVNEGREIAQRMALDALDEAVRDALNEGTRH